MKNTSSDNSANELQVIGIHVGGEEYGLPLELIKEVVATPKITRVPGSEPHISGLINLRGSVIPVLDIANLLGIGRTVLGDNSRIVALEHKGELLGLAAEKVSQIARIAQDDIQPPPSHIQGTSQDLITGVANSRDRFVVFLDLDRLLDRKGSGQSGVVND